MDSAPTDPFAVVLGSLRGAQRENDLYAALAAGALPAARQAVDELNKLAADGASLATGHPARLRDAFAAYLADERRVAWTPGLQQALDALGVGASEAALNGAWRHGAQWLTAQLAAAPVQHCRLEDHGAWADNAAFRALAQLAAPAFAADPVEHTRAVLGTKRWQELQEAVNDYGIVLSVALRGLSEAGWRSVFTAELQMRGTQRLRAEAVTREKVLAELQLALRNVAVNGPLL